MAETAYFMEKGEIRFSGATAELLDRPDLLRSVFLEGAGRATGNGGRLRVSRRHAQAPRPTAARGDGETARRRRCRPSTSPGPSAASARSTTSPSAWRPGEIVGIIGPNGAGKTTLFDVISGFTPEDGGRILLAGHDISGLSPNRVPSAAWAGRSRTPACSRP